MYLLSSVFSIGNLKSLSSNSVFNNSQFLRDDKVEKSLDRDEVMKLAPKSDGVYFKVPKVIDGDD